MAKNKKYTETEAVAPQSDETFVSAAAPTAAAASKKNRKLGGWAITGIAAAGLLVLTGTAGAGAAVGIAASHSIVGHEGGREFAEAGKLGGEHRERGGDFGEMRQHDKGEFRGQMPQSPQGQRNQMRDGETLDDQMTTDGQTQQSQRQQGEQQQMQRPYMNGQTGAS